MWQARRVLTARLPNISRRGESMTADPRHRWLRSVLLIGLAYAIIGVLTGSLAQSASSIRMQTVWRLAAWLLSLALFAGQVTYERLRLDSSAARTALRAAGAVAIGAFLLAAVGPVRSYWGTERFWQVTVLSLLLWPVGTGVPAYLVALVA
ncbi:MAG TPA: hypothetical protein VF021_07100, partial [Longimicrobiales bacterium]